MASTQQVVPFNVLNYVVQNRRTFILASLAAAFAGIGLLGSIFARRRSQNLNYSRTAEIACLLRYV
jgi:hypothetical protein